jgi:hypothetical protein
VFTVRYIDASGQFIVSAFPTYPPNRRGVLIDLSFFGDDHAFDRDGCARAGPHACSGTSTSAAGAGGLPRRPAYDTLNPTDYDPLCRSPRTTSRRRRLTELAITELDRPGRRRSTLGAALSMMLVDRRGRWRAGQRSGPG